MVIEAVPGTGTQLTSHSEEHRLLAYRVQLEIADDAVLPTYVPDEPSQTLVP